MIKFKESKSGNIFAIGTIALGFFVIILSESVSVGKIAGYAAILYGLHIFNSIEIHSIKKYLNEQEVKNGIE